MIKILSLQQLFTYQGCDVTVVGKFPSKEKTPQSESGADCRVESCTVYIAQLIRTFGTPPPQCCFFILQTNGITGTNYEAALLYPREDVRAVNYASLIALGDLFWDDAAKKHLQQIIPSLKTSL